MTSIADRLLDKGRLVALVLLPLLSAPFLSEQRELPRMALAELIGLGALALAAGSGRLRLEASAQRAGLLAAGACLVASAAASSPGRSFFGPYEGHFGALSLLGYLAWAAVPPSSSAARLSWARALVGMGALESVGALVQRAQGGEAIGTLGHIVFLAGFCMLSACMAWSLLLRETRPRWTAAWAVALLLDVAALTATGRRGPFLGLLVGGATVAVLSRRKLVSLRRAWVMLIAAAGVVLLAAQAPPPGQKNVFARFAESATGSVPARWDTVQRRLGLYRIGLEAFLDHPILGTGFGSFRDRAARQATREEEVELSVHDLPLELLSSTGALGAAAFLLLAVVVGRGAKRALAVDPSPELVGAAGLVAAELVFLLFNFDQPAMATWAAALAGWLIPPASETPSPARSVVVVSASLGLLALAPVLADTWAAAGLRAERAGDVARAESDLQTATRWAPYECFYPLREVALLRETAPATSSEERIRLLEPCLRREPDSAFLHYHLGLAYADRAAVSGAAERAQGLVELGRAVSLAPAVAAFHHALAQALVVARDFPSALTQLNAALANSVGDADSAGYLNDRGNVLALLGRTAEAAESYQAAAKLDPGQARSQQNLEALQRHAPPQETHPAAQ